MFGRVRSAGVLAACGPGTLQRDAFLVLGSLVARRSCRENVVPFDPLFRNRERAGLTCVESLATPCGETRWG